MSDELQRKVEKLAEDQVSLTRNVDRVTLLFEQSEKDRSEDKDLIKEIGQVIKTLDKKLDGMDGLASKVAEMDKTYTGQFSSMRHDVANLQNMVITGKMVEKVASIEATIKTWNDERNRIQGRREVIGFMGKVFYLFVSVGGLSVLYAILHFFFGVNLHMTRTPNPIIQTEKQYESQLDNPDSPPL